MTNEKDEIIKELQNQIEALKKQKQILFDFTQLVPDFVSAAISSLPNAKATEEKLNKLQMAAFKAMTDINNVGKVIV